MKKKIVTIYNKKRSVWHLKYLNFKYKSLKTDYFYFLRAQGSNTILINFELSVNILKFP